MRASKTLLALGVAVVLLGGCKQQADAAAEAPVADATEADATPDAPAEQTAAPDADAAPAAPAAVAFDISAIPVSDKPLPEWPYVALPAGYAYDDADDMAGSSKDLARAAVWTGGQLLWVEGRVFDDGVDNIEDKTYSKFELRKNLQQAIEALGGVRVAERSFDEATFKANEKALDDFRQEFDAIRDAYWYDADADTWVIRRADKAIWVVLTSGNERGGLMVVEGPLPEVPAE